MAKGASFMTKFLSMLVSITSASESFPIAQLNGVLYMLGRCSSLLPAERMETVVLAVLSREPPVLSREQCQKKKTLLLAQESRRDWR